MGEAFSNLFGRDFVIGYFLPAAALVFFSISILAGIVVSAPPNVVSPEISSNFQWANIKQLMSDSSLTWILGSFLVVGWLVAVVFSSVNYQIIRIFEGYDDWWNPLRLLKWLRRAQFAKLSKIANDHEAQVERGAVATNDGEYEDAITRLAMDFPDNFDENGLGTRLGNVVRAFEVYPRVMYGLEGIQGWTRLVAVIPKEYLTLINAAKAQVDLCLNMVVVLLLCLVEYIALCAAIYGTEFKSYPFPAVPVILGVWAWISTRSAASAAEGWGEWVKSAFDVFLGDLRAKLGFDAFDNSEAERERWVGLSQAIIFRAPDLMPPRRPAGGENIQQPKKGTIATTIERWFGKAC